MPLTYPKFPMLHSSVDRTLKRQFALDDEALDDLKEQLIDADQVAVDEDGRV